MKNQLINLTYPLSFACIVALLTIAACTDPGEHNVTPPKELITLSRAGDLYQAYDSRAKALTKLKGSEDSRYGWHSIEFYKDYIAYLEKEAGSHGEEISGLRMYYVAYPDNDPKNEQAGYQTYMYVPTYYDEKQDKHIAFDPKFMNEDGTPVPIERLLSGKGGAAKSLMNAEQTDDISSTSSIANFAEMCKPHCH